MIRDEIKLIRAHLLTTIKDNGPEAKIPVKAGTLLAMVDLILSSDAPTSSKGRA